MNTPNTCGHRNVRCINYYEYFRKYLCEDCGGVFMCACEQKLALIFLSHQVSFGTEYGTRQSYKVEGFAIDLCAECRGEKETAHPRAAIYGQKGKVERFYWREIYKTYCEYSLEWLERNAVEVKDILEFQNNFPDKAKDLQKNAKNYWQSRHKRLPKYSLKELTEHEFLSNVQVPIIEIEGEYRQVKKGGQRIGKWVNSSSEMVTVEDFVAEKYRKRGFSVVSCERNFVSVWVGTFLAQQIQDQEDKRVRPTFRNSTKGWTSRNRNTRLITIFLPEDFGSAEYYLRRKSYLQEGVERMREASNLQLLFDELLVKSEPLRDYLWVNNDEVVGEARSALSIIPKEVIINCVHWAIQNFWKRQPGWPDLFISKGETYRFCEVKSPHDELSLEQMQWFRWAIEEAHIPCEICRVRREGYLA